MSPLPFVTTLRRRRRGHDVSGRRHCPTGRGLGDGQCQHRTEPADCSTGRGLCDTRGQRLARSAGRQGRHQGRLGEGSALKPHLGCLWLPLRLRPALGLALPLGLTVALSLEPALG